MPNKEFTSRLLPFFVCFIVGAIFMGVGTKLPAQRLVSAPIQGHTTSNTFKIWLMTKGTEKVELFLSEGEIKKGKKTITITNNQFWHDLNPMTVEFWRLEPGKNYHLRVKLDGEDWPEQFAFSTLPEAVPESYSFTLGSCLLLVQGGWKALYPDKTGIFKKMQAMDTDFMLWLGDNVYLLLGEWNEARRMQKKYAKVRLDKVVNNYLRSRPNYATWDDHDFGPDNSDSSFPNKDATLANFQSFWPNPYFGNGSTKGVFSHFKHHDSEFFLLDDRYHRIKKDHQQMLGQGQMAWLKERLKASNATFKFITNGSQVLNKSNDYECFALFDEQKELLQFIRDERIEGVVFLSGDRHFSELLKYEQEGCYPLYEYTNSPLTSPVRKKPGKPGNPEYNNPLRVPGTQYNARNFGTIEISGPLEDRICTLRLFSKKGKLIWSHDLKARELQFH